MSLGLTTNSRGQHERRPSLFEAFPDIKPTGKHEHIIDAMGAAHADTMRRRSGAAQWLAACSQPFC